MWPNLGLVVTTFKKGDRVRRLWTWDSKMTVGSDWVVSEILDRSAYDGSQVIKVEGSDARWISSSFTLIKETKPAVPSWIKHFPAVPARNVLEDHTFDTPASCIHVGSAGKDIRLRTNEIHGIYLDKKHLRELGEHLIEVSKWMEE